jgi:hypothetical protein
MIKAVQAWGEINTYAWFGTLLGLAWYLYEGNSEQVWTGFLILMIVHASQLAQTLLFAFFDSRQQ